VWMYRDSPVAAGLRTQDRHGDVGREAQFG
jgi:hypothetical protein